MNVLHARRWLEACAACDPESSYAGPLKLLEACEGLPGEWEGAVRGGEVPRLRLRRAGPLSDEERSRAASVLGPKVGKGGFDAEWDIKRGEWTRLRAPEDGAPAPFRPASFGAPAAKALADFHALAPVSSCRRRGGEWTLELARPIGWPHFLRCDLSAAFAPRAAQLSLLLRGARVRALDFDGEALWARFSG